MPSHSPLTTVCVHCQVVMDRFHGESKRGDWLLLVEGRESVSRLIMALLPREIDHKLLGVQVGPDV